MSSVVPSFEHFVYFTYKLEWDIPKEFEPQGYLSVFLPKSFPLNTQIIRIPIEKRNGFFEKTIDACVDDFFIDSAIRKSFMHTIRYSSKDLKVVQDKLKNKLSTKNKNNNDVKKKSKLGKTEYQEKFTCEYVFLDAGKLFIPDRNEASITVSMEIFDYLTFSIQIDDELLSIPHIKKFAPTILYINKIDNLFTNATKLEDFNELSMNPIYFECLVGESSYFLVPRYDRNQKSISVDATILVSPRQDQSIVFRIYDKTENIPENFIGSGLYISTKQNSKEEEEEDHSENIVNEKGQLAKSISEENLLLKENQTKDKISKNHHHHHHSKKKNNQKDESFVQTMKKVEEIASCRPFIQFTSPVKLSPHSTDKLNNNNIILEKSPLITKTKSHAKTPGNSKIQSGRKSRIKEENQNDIRFTPIQVSKLSRKTNSSQYEDLLTDMSPVKQPIFENSQNYGYCQFYLLPERHATLKMISSTNDNSYKDVTVSFDIYDPAVRFPPPNESQEIKRPLIVHKRPSVSSTNQKETIFDNCKYDNKKKTNSVEKQPIQKSINVYITQNKEFFANDNSLCKIFPEDSKILSIEKPTIKLLRWILTCSRFSPVSLKLLNFIQNFHKTTIHGFSHILNPCFKNCFRKSPDLITGFHFLSPKEEVFVLETRACRPNKATLSLELFLRNEMPSETHIIANNSIVFSAPRLYCCTEELIQRVEIPIPLDELLQINGLYFHKNENHKLFPIAQKLSNLLQARKLTDIMNSYPNYSEIKILEKRAPGLYAAPLQKSLTIKAIIHTKGADFGEIREDNNNNLNIIDSCFAPINIQQNQSQTTQDQLKEKKSENSERLTTYYLAKPNIPLSTKQRNESASTRLRKKSVHEEMNEGREKDDFLNKEVYIKPPDDSNKSLSKKAPRSISSAKQPS